MSETSYLSKIVEYKKQELVHRKRRVTLQDIRFMAGDAEPARDFIQPLRIARSASKIGIIAEVKKASPSAGLIRADFDPSRIAQQYEKNGASCVSVLTDEHFFKGSLNDLGKIRQRVRLPLLRKDFTLDEYHLYEARAAGADAVLLIARILVDTQLRDYEALASELGMAVLIEVHEEGELQRGLKMSRTPLIGINNRNLKTFQVDLKVTLSLAPKVPSDRLVIAESGISRREEIRRLRGVGVSAFLIGESLLCEKDPGKRLKELMKVCGNEG